MPVILFLSANGRDDAILAVGREAREARASMRAADRGAFDFRVESDVAPDEIVALVQQYQPAVLHFSGHGDPDGSVNLQGALVAPGVLQAIVGSCPRIQAVVLNACYSGAAAPALRARVPVVIGMKHDISDKSARVFSQQLYFNLARGDSMRAAFSAAASAMAANDAVDADAPQIFEASDGVADSLVLRRPAPEIRAVFECGRSGRPVRRDQWYYGMHLYMHDARADTSGVVYQLDQEYETASKEGAFREVGPTTRGFRTWIQTEGDFLIRATIWRGRRGTAIDAFVVEALRRHYDSLDAVAWNRLDREAIYQAIDLIEQDA